MVDRANFLEEASPERKSATTCVVDSEMDRCREERKERNSCQYLSYTAWDCDRGCCSKKSRDLDDQDCSASESLIKELRAVVGFRAGGGTPVRS